MSGKNELNTASAKRAVRSAISRAVNLGLAEIQSEAAALAPIREGTLRGSATLTPADWSGNQVTGKVSFPVVYAGVQHERTDFDHPRGGQAKYLSTAVRQSEGRLQQMIQRNVKAALDGTL